MSDSAVALRKEIREEPFTLEDGSVVFHEDGSTTLNITIPPGNGHGGGPQYDRLVRRLLELALAWSGDGEAA